MQHELGLSEVKWNQSNGGTSTEALNGEKINNITNLRCDQNSSLMKPQESLNATKEIIRDKLNDRNCTVMDSFVPKVIKNQNEDSVLINSKLSQAETKTSNNDIEESIISFNNKTTNLNLTDSFEFEFVHPTPNINSDNSQLENFNTASVAKQNVDDSLNRSCSNTFVSDQSLFEESFDLNQQFATCSVWDEKPEEVIHTSRDTSTNGNSGDSGLDFDSGSFLENVFASSFELETSKLSDEIIDHSQTEINPVVVSSHQISTESDNEISDLVLNSQGNSSNLNNLIINKSSKLVCSKRARKENAYKTSIVDEDESLQTAHTPKKRKIETTQLYSTILNKPKCSIPVDLTKLDVVDVCGDETLYNTFCSELFEQKVISLSLACKKASQSIPIIGLNILNKNSEELITPPIEQFVYKEHQVVGISITWGDNIAYYISFDDKSAVLNPHRSEIFKKLCSLRTLIVRIFDSKEQIKIAKLCLDWDFDCIAEDPKVGDWLLDPEGKEKNLQAMVR